MTIELITAPTPELHEAMARLLPQLSRSAKPMSEADVERFLAQGSVHLFVFRPDAADDEGNHPILGMLSLATDLAAMPTLRPIEGRIFDMFPHTTHAEVALLLERA